MNLFGVMDVVVAGPAIATRDEISTCNPDAVTVAKFATVISTLSL